MPLKDLAARAEYARAQYLANRPACLARSKARRERVLAAKLALATESYEIHTVPVQRLCTGCATDITFSYVSKRGPLCVSCHKAYHKAYREANASAIAESKRDWKQRNAEHVARKDRAYADANPGKRSLARKVWDMKNPGATLAAKAENYARRKKRVPTWLSEDDKWMIAQAYALAKLRTDKFGFMWHVDHVIPMSGRSVSGLHVPTNLQVIPWADNLRKCNTYEVL